MGDAQTNSPSPHATTVAAAKRFTIAADLAIVTIVILCL
jgi:hypothetical protein